MQRVVTGQSSKNAGLGVLLCIIGLVLMIALVAMPVYRLEIPLFEKRSGNTFPGDERYLAARAEAEAVYKQYSTERDYGNVTLKEDQILRTNSKGIQTSMMTFTVNAVITKTALEFARSELVTGKLLLLCLLLAFTGAGIMAFSRPMKLPADHRDIVAGTIRLRRIACWMALASLFLVPLFYFSTVRLIQRELLMPLKYHLPDQPTALISAFGSFLFGGRAGDTVASLLEGIVHGALPALWGMGFAACILLTGMVLLSEGTISVALRRSMLYLFVIALCIVILYPYYAMLITALRSNAETTDMYFTAMLPRVWKFSNLTDILDKNIPTYLLNSLLIAGGATVTALLCGIPAAYAMARMRFKGRGVFLGFVIMSQMFAPIVLLVGISRLMNMLRLKNTLLGLMLINAAFNQAFAIWLLRGTFVAISPEMEQAACIDGCNTVTALIRVLLPMAMPGIVTTLIFVFINAWNEYTISTVLITSPLLRPITVGITQFSSFNMIQWHYLFASALLATIPVVILFMLIEKHLVSGLTSGGVKG